MLSSVLTYKPHHGHLLSVELRQKDGDQIQVKKTATYGHVHTYINIMGEVEGRGIFENGN